MAPRVLVVVNPKSRRGEEDVRECLEHLTAEGLSARSVPVDGSGGIAEAIRRNREGVQAIVIGGGDGTIHAAAGALVESRLPVGLLPLGTANDLARTLAIPADLKSACHVIAEARTRAIDIGRVNGIYFFNAANIGLAVDVARALKDDDKRRWGVLAYLAALRQELVRNRSFSASLRYDGRQVRLRALQITVGNGRHYGGGLTVHEQADIDDCRLDVYCLEPQSLWRWARLGLHLRRGTHGSHPGVHLFHCQRVEVRTRRPMPVTADGEPAAHTPAMFDLVPKALTMYVPA